MTKKAHLLIVDDDPSTLASLSRAFRLAGHEATVSDNAARALDLVRNESFDLILSDVMMPGKTGIEFLEDLKKAGVKTPVVLVSGQANIEMAVHATKLGAIFPAGLNQIAGQMIKQDDPEVFFESRVHEPPHILMASKPMREYDRALPGPGDLGIVSRCHTHQSAARLPFRQTLSDQPH